MKRGLKFYVLFIFLHIQLTLNKLFSSSVMRPHYVTVKLIVFMEFTNRYTLITTFFIEVYQITTIVFYKAMSYACEDGFCRVNHWTYR